jgi:hypothetical protein
VKALIVGCVTREHHAVDPTARQRMIAIVCTGLNVASPR